MIDLKFLRENPDLVKENIKKEIPGPQASTRR